MRMIDANAFIKEHCADCKYFNVDGICTKEYPVCGSVVIVAELPTIDAVEVVRCKDCKHYYYSAYAMRCVCDFDNKEWDKDDFCSYGERRTDK